MINKAIAHIDTIKQHSFKTLGAAKGEKSNSLEIFLLLMLDRLHNSSKSLELLLRDYDKHPTHDFSIGIILRSVLLDTIITINLYNAIEENMNKTESEIKQILEERAELYLSDGFAHIVGNLETDYNNGFISAEELKHAYNSLVGSYTAFFEEYPFDGSKPKVRYKKQRQEQLNDTIRKSPTLKNLTGIINRYEFYSKYDHFTFIHYEMMRQGGDAKKERIIASIEDVVIHSLILHTLIREVYPEDFFVEQSDLIARYAEEQIINARMKS